MAGLTDTTIAASYDQLLIVDRDGGGNSTTHVTVKDGDGGTTFPITLATDSIMITSTNRLEFGDDASYIHQSADGVLDLVSDTEIEINATTIDINGALDVSGNITMADDTSIGISDSDERIEFDGAGDISVLGANFGVGTSSPGGTLHTALGSESMILHDTYSTTDGSATTLRLRKSANDTVGTLTATGDGDVLGSLVFMGVDSGSNFDRGAEFTATQNGSIGARVPTDLKIETYSSSAKNTNQFFLSNNGNVGIGTSTVNANLVIENSDGVQLALHDSSDPGWGFKKDRISSSENLYLGTMTKAGTFASKATFLEGGNVYFNDVFKFYTDTTPEMHIVDSDDSNYALIGYYDGRLDISSNHGNEVGGADIITLNTSGFERVRITNTGVGIGTTSPSYPLEIANSAGDTVQEISCWSTSEGHNSRLVFQKSGNATIGTLTPTEINENLGVIEFYGVNNAGTPAIKMGAYILAEQDAAKDATAVPTRLMFATSDADDDGAPTERMRIDDAGNVGIGTTSPASTLEVAGKLTVDDSNAYIDLKRSGTTISTIGADATGEFIVYDTSASAYRMAIDSSGSVEFSGTAQETFQAKSSISSDAIFKFTKSTVNGGAANLKIQGYRNTGTNDTAILSFDNNTTTCARIYMKRVDDNSGNLVLGSGDSGTITDHMTIDNAGKVLLGTTTTSDNARLIVHYGGHLGTGVIRAVATEASSTPEGYSLYYSNQSPDNDGWSYLFQDSTTTRFIVRNDGDIENHDNDYGATSDERIKDNITDATSQWDDIKALRVRNFQRKDDIDQYGADKAMVQIGLIAQEVEPISPGLIEGKKGNDYEKDVLKIDGDVKVMKYSVLYMKAIKALQEAMERIEALENA